MSLKARVTDDMKAAMRAKDAPRLSAIRLLLSAMKQKEVDERVELSDADVVAIIDKMLKQRRESIAQFEKGGRQDLADKEAAEILILEAYLPPAADPAAVENAVSGAIAETGATSLRDLGRVMADVMPQVAGRADGSVVSQLVREKLA